MFASEREVQSRRTFVSVCSPERTFFALKFGEFLVEMLAGRLSNSCSHNPPPRKLSRYCNKGAGAMLGRAAEPGSYANRSAPACVKRTKVPLSCSTSQPFSIAPFSPHFPLLPCRTLENVALAVSNTSISDETAEWSRCLRAFLVTLAICVSLVFAFVISVDPYDSGKFGFFGIKGVADRNTVTASASRARDASFDSAIIGNSTALLINPTRLSQATGLRFVQLSVVGASPREEITVLDFFLRHHAHVGALVIGADPGWCAHDLNANPRPFPYWLYDDNRIAYAAALFSAAAIEHAVQRVSIGLGQRQPRDPTGTFDSEDTWPIGEFRDINRPSDPPLAARAALRNVFPEVSRLDELIKQLPADVPRRRVGAADTGLDRGETWYARGGGARGVQRGPEANRGRPTAQQFHQLSRRQRADAGSCQLHRLHPLPVDYRESNS